MRLTNGHSAVSRVVGRRAFSLPEMLITLAASTVIFGAVAAFFMYGNQSFVAIGNYMDLNRRSCAALDWMSRDIRQSVAVMSFSTNSILLRLPGTNTVGAPVTNFVMYLWDPVSRNVTRFRFGAGVPSQANVLLSECDYLCFRIFQRNPMPGRFEFYPATNLSGAYQADLCKLVEVSWRCSRTIKGTKLQTESVQTAKICMRN
ncbi:MAG: prepilin-type N-terminal cleavage/methylation domain-containing protein [Verrucomicrobiae bacterium]|nr:prepilin-type N-terminal cleavage/methylation domain-containing protein [Verrucomicrobiae bacterium]MCX7721459.1 prepilin-type N-terminal cleavage/methylation domain-containing protein [Verrucomicrobiae bacterium]MDW7979692.1 prepilin-type N-terminal cleavage/methylation domain-containing protein [Verrucomicrobiales bacterium]